MSFLNTGFTPTVSARLTKAGRNAIAKGDFIISYFSIGDSEYNYNLSGLTSQRVFAPLDKNTHVKYPFLYQFCCLNLSKIGCCPSGWSSPSGVVGLMAASRKISASNDAMDDPGPWVGSQG